MPPAAGGEENGEGGNRRILLIAGGIVAIIVLVAATLGFAARESGGDDTAAAPSSQPDDPATTSPSTEGPSSTTTAPADPVSEAEFRALIDELEAYVEQARGLEFLREVEVELEDDAAFEARLLEGFEEDADDIEEAEVFYRALGLIGPEQRLLDLLRDIYSVGVLGFYDTETDELVVRGSTPTPYVQKTIVHELVHALDDQHFELFRPEYDDRKDEIGTGFSAVVEGNASRVEDEWLGDQPADFREQARREELAFAAGIDVSAFPPILLFEIGAPYQQGKVFVNRLVGESGERGADAALTDPPETSEQFLFPDLWTSREPRIEVPVPPAGGDPVADGVIGALFLYGLFTTGNSSVNPSDAFRAIDGWGGDWAVTWVDGDRACVRADFVGDTDGDTDELESALTLWAESVDAARVSRADGRVRLESCGAAGGTVPPQV